MYSVGSVFLQVIPSFDGVQRKSAREGAKAGEAMADGFDNGLKDIEAGAATRGKNAGKKYSGAFEKSFRDGAKAMKAAYRDMGDSVTKDLRRVRKDIDFIGKTKFTPGMDPGPVLLALTRIRQAAQGIRNDKTLDLQLRVNVGAIDEAAKKSLADLRKYSGLDPELIRQQNQLQAEGFRQARAEAENRKRDQAELNQLQANGAMQTRALNENRRRDLAAISAREREIHNAQKQAARDELDSLRMRRAGLEDLLRKTRSGQVNIGTQGVARALAEIRQLDAELDRISGNNRRLSLNVGNTTGDRIALRRLAEAFEDVGKEARRANVATNSFDAGSAANSVRLFSGALFAIVTLGPMLIPLLGGIAAGILGIGTAAGAAVMGIGVMVLGLAGIGGAVGALGDVDKERRKQQREKGGGSSASDTRALENAQRDLTRTREDAGRRISAALRQEADAERNLARAREDAARSIAQAEERQVQAQERVAESIRDVQRAQEALTEAREAATRQLEDMNAELAGAADAERRAELALQEARVHQNVVLEDDQATAREKELAGLDVREAERALERTRTQNKRLREDTAEANKLGVEGSKQVVSAKEAEQEAVLRVGEAQVGLVKAQQDVVLAHVEGAEKIADAQRNLAEQTADVARARVEEARTLADAERRVGEAMVDLQKKTVDAGVAGSSAMDNLREAMLGLSPAGRDFALFLYGLKPLLDDLRFAAQEGFLPGLQQAMGIIIDKYGPGFTTFVGTMAKVLGDLAVAFAEMFTSPFWEQFFGYMAEVMPVFMEQWGKIGMALLTFVAAVLQAFTPLGIELMDFFVGVAEGMALWAQSPEGLNAMQSFIDYVRESGPRVWELLTLIFEVIGKLLVGLAPYADKLIELAISFFGYLASMDPDDLAKIALAVIAVVAGIQALAGLMSVINQVVLLIAGVAGSATLFGILALVLLGLALIIATQIVLWTLFGDFYRDVLDKIGEATKWVWEKVLKPIWDAMVWIWEKVIAPVFTWLYESIIKPVWDLISAAFQVGWDVMKVIFDMIDQIIRFVIAPAFNWLYDNVIKPVWDKIKPLLEAFGAFVRDHVAPVIEEGLGIVERLWNGLLDMLRTPIRLGLELVINKGLIGAFNWLAEKIPGMTKIDPIPIPDALQPGGGRSHRGGSYYTGGVLGGYTPGRDVHRFVSPTGGTLDLSGGEGILRPELTAAIGRARWDAANRKAREGDIAGGLGALGVGGHQAHAKGGWWDTIANGAGRAASNVGGWVRDRGTDVIDAATSAVQALKDPVGFLRTLVGGMAEDAGMGGFLGDAVTAVALSPIDKIGDLISGLLSKADQGANGAQGPGWNGGPGMGWQKMWSLVSGGVPGISLNSAFRPGAITALGTPSMHGAGRAIDISPSMAAFNWIKANFPESKEIIFSPAGAGQVYKGKNHFYGEPTRGDHWDHVHWGYDKGGILGDMANLYDTGGDLPPGLTLALNKTGKTEHVLTDRMMQDIKNTRSEGFVFTGDMVGYTVEELAAALFAERRRQEAAFGFTQIEEMVL